MLLPAPKNLRDLIDGMAAVPAPTSIEDVKRFDWSKSTVEEIYNTFLDRKAGPETVDSDLAASDRVNIALGLMEGEEFQRRIIELVLRAGQIGNV